MICVIAAILSVAVTVFSGIVFFANLDYFERIGSDIAVIVCFVFCVIASIIAIFLACKVDDYGDEQHTYCGISVIFLSLVLLVVPIRGCVIADSSTSYDSYYEEEDDELDAYQSIYDEYFKDTDWGY